MSSAAQVPDPAQMQRARTAIAQARAAFPLWAATDPRARRKGLLALADALRADAPRFQTLAAPEAGAETAADLRRAVEILEAAAGACTLPEGSIAPMDAAGRIQMQLVQPRGVCLGIVPAVAPISHTVRAFAFAIALGNTVVILPFEGSRDVHGLIGQCVERTGLPPGVVGVVPAAPGEGTQLAAALIAATPVRHVSFAGPQPAARLVGRLAGENLKPMLLELQGRSVLIVLDDADLEATADAVLAAPDAALGPVIVQAAVAEALAANIAARGGDAGALWLLKVPGDGAALAAALDGAPAPGCAIFSRDLGRALWLAEGVGAANCTINRLPLPDGGPAASDGRFCGASGLAEFTERRRIGIDAPLWPHQP
ncbi:aldehyde dehydrogenase family protein [Paracoccus limosus]|uniref:Aldehyde dehydrogenase family protein n=1 Tax=Paracoccus limosus TaxID=913252 RepID=A0A844H869_9RHOB|nr:aldehyde dehydrogenase family protein [Paracoccus limosus]MTH35501.1 aldehyde dehydrogenase family protein [Paracoccus limosus]